VAFQSGAVDQPACGQLDLRRVGCRIVRHIGIKCRQAFGLLAADDRILEEAPGVARHRRVGQLGPADRTNGLADVAQRDASPRFDLCGQVPVFEAGSGRAAQRKADRSDDYTSPQGAFEDAVPVPERAVFSVQDERVEGLCAEHLDASDRILGLAAVSPDVLNRSSPDFAGDEREVFQSPQFVLYGPFDQVVPLDARVGFDRHAVRLFVHDADTLCHRGQQRTGIVLREEDVVASSEDVPRIRHSFLEEFL
jgi:hypothetical protein